MCGKSVVSIPANVVSHVYIYAQKRMRYDNPQSFAATSHPSGVWPSLAAMSLGDIGGRVSTDQSSFIVLTLSMYSPVILTPRLGNVREAPKFPLHLSHLFNFLLFIIGKFIFPLLIHSPIVIRYPTP